MTITDYYYYLYICMCTHKHEHMLTPVTHPLAHTPMYAYTHTLELEASHPEMMLSRGCGHTSPCYRRGWVVVHLCLDMSCLLHTHTHTHTHAHTHTRTLL